MTAEFVRERITQLRMQKGVSEYKMSCEYFDITPIDFFNGRVEDPKLMKKTINGLEQLEREDLELIQKTVDRLLK